MVVDASCHDFRSLSVLTDVNIPLKNLDSKLFPGVSSSVQVHGGFADQHAQTASIILTAVKSLLSETGSSNVFLVSNLTLKLDDGTSLSC